MAGPTARIQDNRLKWLLAPRGKLVRRDDWTWVFALAFVTVTLAVLVAIPMIVQRSVDRHRASVQASEPARTLLMRLQYNLVREWSALNQFALTSDSTHARNFRRARAAEALIWNDLGPLAASLGDRPLERYTNARSVAESWHRRLNEDELLRRGLASIDTLQATDIRRRFEQVLAATSRFDASVIQAARRSRARIVEAERMGLQLTLLSGALALLAAGVVMALVVRIRRLAIEADRRRRETTAALAENARVTEARQHLLRGITHDVKNPLGSAHGYAELLNLQIKGPLNHDQKRLVDGVERSIDGALAIISDLLDLARADSGGMHVDRVITDMNEVARDAVEDQKATAEKVGHEMRVVGTPAPLYCFTDPTRVRQVLDNLLSNAIKYTPPPGTIVVRTDSDAVGAPLTGRVIAVSVIDSGPGIPAAQRESVFDEFARVDDHNRALKGHGLGLAIARRIARLLGGELTLVDKDEPGCHFVLWLPQREQRERPRRVGRGIRGRAGRSVWRS